MVAIVVGVIIIGTAAVVVLAVIFAESFFRKRFIDHTALHVEY